MITKTCTKCLTEKTTDDFYPVRAGPKRSKDGLNPRCKPCVKEDRRLAYAKRVGYDPATVDRRKLGEFRGTNQLPLMTRLEIQSVENPVTGCRVMTKVPTTSGYAQIRYNGKLYLAHVIVYKASGRPLEPGQEVDHLCNNRLCINPQHLEAVSHAENTRRSYERGRRPVISRRKLTTGQAQEIRDLYAAGGVSQQALADQFKISRTHVNGIINHRRRSLRQVA